MKFFIHTLILIIYFLPIIVFNLTMLITITDFYEQTLLLLILMAFQTFACLVLYFFLISIFAYYLFPYNFHNKLVLIYHYLPQ